MALVHANSVKSGSRLALMFSRHLSNAAKVNPVKKSVFISQSTDVFTNLALEDWIYRNYNFANHHILLLWRNNPCVVIGRHQNPWLETNVADLGSITEGGAKLARRNTGGGTAYHDRGNLNITFFFPRTASYNSETITRALFRKYGIKVQTSPAGDILMYSNKISEAASKLGTPSAYYHCTLNININKVDLNMALHKQEHGIKTNATKSLKTKMMNLCEENSSINVDGVLSAIGLEYMRLVGDTLLDGGTELANQQKGFQMINPSEQWFPGITAIKNTFMDWEWCYGKTPKFTITKSFPIPPHFSEISYTGGADNNLHVTMVVERGKICDVTLIMPPSLYLRNYNQGTTAITSLKGRRFSDEVFDSFALSFDTVEASGVIHEKEKFVTECVQHMMTSV